MCHSFLARWRCCIVLAVRDIISDSDIVSSSAIVRRKSPAPAQHHARSGMVTVYIWYVAAGAVQYRLSQYSTVRTIL